MPRRKLAVVTSHPIQYNAPLFRLLQERGNIQIKVFYTWEQSQKGQLFDPGFGKKREWDIPLLEKYEFEFIENTAKEPGSHHFLGIVNPDLIQKIILYNPDAILVYGWSFYSHLKVLRYFKKKIPIYFRGDSTLLDFMNLPLLKKIFRKIFLRWVYSHIDKVFYVGKSNKQYFIAYGLKKHQLIFAPHCIDNIRFSQNKEYYEEQAKIWRRQMGISDKTIVFLFAGKLEPKKNPFLLIETFQSIVDDHIRLIIVGNGVLEKQSKLKANDDPRILFIDFQNQSRMPIVYRLGDVFILPSKGPGETWGLSVNEAMASGRPAIVSDVCGCTKDLIIEGKTGYSFRSDNMLDLRRCMKLFIDRHFNSSELIIESHISNYNMDINASVIESVLKNTALTSK